MTPPLKPGPYLRVASVAVRKRRDSTSSARNRPSASRLSGDLPSNTTRTGNCSLINAEECPIVVDRFRIRRVFLAVLIFGVTACGGDGTGLENVAGLYTLQTIDGDPLPWVLFQAGASKIEVTAGNVILNADMSCTNTFTYTTTESGNVTTETETDECTYTINGGAIALTFPFVGGFTNSGSIVGSTLTITSQLGAVAIFQK